VREIVQSINEALERLGRLAAEPFAARALAMLLAALTLVVLAFRIWGSKPSDRFGPTAPAGSVAAVAEKVAIFSARSANLLYPLLIARRHFERLLLRAAGLKPPTDIGAIVPRVRSRLNELQQAELRGLLVELDELSSPARETATRRVSPRQFLSLWRRISAMLNTLGDTQK
jgi:hypothetical protein